MSDGEKLGRLIERRFQSSSMSDSKWVRLLKGLTEQYPALDCRAKLVWDDRLRDFALAGAQYRFDFWERAVEGLISRQPPGWTLYREIEWIEFPSCYDRPLNEDNLKAGTESVVQDLSKIQATIEGLGQFDIYREPDCLRLYAYR